jgi:hypothetical protein
MVKGAKRRGEIRGIILPRASKQQTTSYYVDDTSISIKGEKTMLHNVVSLFQKYLLVGNLEINWEKSIAY